MLCVVESTAGVRLALSIRAPSRLEVTLCRWPTSLDGRVLETGHPGHGHGEEHPSEIPQEISGSVTYRQNCHRASPRPYTAILISSSLVGNGVILCSITRLRPYVSRAQCAVTPTEC
jgi:hypothetical protein